MRALLRQHLIGSAARLLRFDAVLMLLLEKRRLIIVCELLCLLVRKELRIVEHEHVVFISAAAAKGGCVGVVCETMRKVLRCDRKLVRQMMRGVGGAALGASLDTGRRDESFFDWTCL